MPKRVEELLIKQLDEAYAMEQTVLDMLSRMAKTTSDPSVRASIESHQQETEEHAEKVKRCLEACVESPSKARQMLGSLTALMKTPADLVRSEQHLAKAADDKQALQLASEISADEERMAAHIQKVWERVVASPIEDGSYQTA